MRFGKESGHMIERIDHVNIVVRDLPSMTAFYRDVLGLKVTNESADFGRMDRPGSGTEKCDGRCGLSRSRRWAEGGVDSISLTRRIAAGRTGESHTAGLRHLAFRVGEIDELVRVNTGWSEEIFQRSADSADSAGAICGRRKETAGLLSRSGGEFVGVVRVQITSPERPVNIRLATHGTPMNADKKKI